MVNLHMPKDKDEGNKRIEGVFGQIGLGNMDPERIREIQEEYERAMELADFLKNKKGRNFRDFLRNTESEAQQNKAVDAKKEK